MGAWIVGVTEMNQRTAPLAVLIVAAITVVAVPAAGLAPGTIGGQSLADDVATEETNETNAAAANETGNASIPPGSQLTGVVDVQKAEIEGEVESRGFEIALNRTDGNASKQAGVVAGEVTDLEDRLAELRDRMADLEQARENDTITEGEYRARIAGVSARLSTVERLANQTANASQGVPEETLREKGVNVSAIQQLTHHARNLSGPEVATIARSIAGPWAGTGLGWGAPANKTPGIGAGQGDTGPPIVPGEGNETSTTGDGTPAGDASDNATESDAAD